MNFIGRIRQLKDYGIMRIFALGFCFLRTQMFYRPALFIFFPLDIRGKRHIELGRGMTCGKGCRFEAYPDNGVGKVLTIGRNVQINDYVHISARRHVSIGDNVLMASRIFISDLVHGDFTSTRPNIQSTPESLAVVRPLTSKDVTIEDNVWIGENVCILPGVVIGRCSVIGAGSVVTRNIPPQSIAGGNPARIIKRYNCDKGEWERADL